MTLSPKTLRISIALLISLVFIAAGYYFSSPLRTSIANATSTEELLKAYAAKDTDSDGLPDWQESLYGTDIANPHSVDPNLTDKEAVDQGKVEPKFKSDTETASSSASSAAEDSFGGAPSAAPGSLTEKFSKEFLKSYLSAGGGQVLNKEDQQVLIAGLLKTFTLEASKEIDSKYTALSIHSSPQESVENYVNAMYAVFGREDISGLSLSEDVISYSKALIEGNDESARAKLKYVSEICGNVAEGLLSITAPSSLSNDHLALVRAFDTMSNVTRHAASYETDPIAALGGFAAYQPSVSSVVAALKNIAAAILKDGEPAPNTPSASIVNFARSLETQ